MPLTEKNAAYQALTRLKSHAPSRCPECGQPLGEMNLFVDAEILLIVDLEAITVSPEAYIKPQPGNSLDLQCGGCGAEIDFPLDDDDLGALIFSRNLVPSD